MLYKTKQLTMLKRGCVSLVRLNYLHGILLPVDGVFRARPPVVAPVQVELDSFIGGRQVST